MDILEEGATVPSRISAYGWIPFVVALMLSLLFSYFFVRYFRTPERGQCPAFTSVVGLCVTLLAAFLLPVDVFLVSFMKNPDGTFKEWATNATRHNVENTVSYLYYSIYGIVIFLAFIVLPLVYFAYEEKDEEHRSFLSTTTVAYTVVFILVVAALFLFGAFLPSKDVPPTNSTEWDKIEFLVKELASNRGQNALFFVVNFLTLYGMFNLICLTAVGMAAFPVMLIKGFRSFSDEEQLLSQSRTKTQSEIKALRDKQLFKKLSSREVSALADLEEEESLISRRATFLEAEKKTLSYKMSPVLRFLNVIWGMVGILFSILLFVSLLITNIDKLLHSLGYNMAYVLKWQRIPNPLDYILIQAQQVFPIDYVIYLSIVVFLLLCTLYGSRYVGLRCLMVKIYQIRPHRTPPQALLMLCFVLMFTILAFNILLYAVLPTYTLYGSQHYTANHTLLPCSMEASSDDCVMTRAASFILIFAYRFWFFGATYFWMSWLILVAFVGSLIYSTIKKPPSFVEEAVGKDDFEDSSDEPILRL